jgi:hypothetical protein
MKENNNGDHGVHYDRSCFRTFTEKIKMQFSLAGANPSNPGLPMKSYGECELQLTAPLLSWASVPIKPKPGLEVPDTLVQLDALPPWDLDNPAEWLNTLPVEQLPDFVALVDTVAVPPILAEELHVLAFAICVGAIPVTNIAAVAIMATVTNTGDFCIFFSTRGSISIYCKTMKNKDTLQTGVADYIRILTPDIEWYKKLWGM